ncbi:MAG: 4-hydroxyphenylacetate 3-hydroxylase family protein [Alphaproteobacteria bacterium]
MAASGDKGMRAKVLPYTGAEYLESLDDGREIWIYGERVKNVTTHPAFRNSARSVARLYDALHDPKTKDVLTTQTDTGNGGFTHHFYRAPYSKDDLRAGRDAIAAWQRQVYGFMGRSPDYKASFLATLGASADFYAPYQDNAKRWYRDAQERVLYVNHALVHPPIDRNRPADETADVCVHVERETDGGIIVSGAKVVATASALTNHNFVAHYGLPLSKPEFAAIFIAPMNSPGLKLLCRQSYEFTAATIGSPFDYPLSSRFDENDSILIFDRVFIPWENVFVYRDVEKTNNFFQGTGFIARALLHGCTRFAVKLDFIAGLFMKAIDAIGPKDARGAQINIGEVIALRNLFWGLTDAMIEGAVPWTGGTLLPSPSVGDAYRVFAPTAYGRVKELVEQAVGSGLIYLPANVVDLKNPVMRPFVDRYLRGSGGYSPDDRVKLMKLFWDSLISEFGGRHELYERNYAGNADDARVQTLLAATANGATDRMRGMVDQCLSEYDLDGWKIPGMVNPDDVNVFTSKNRDRNKF